MTARLAVRLRRRRRPRFRRPAAPVACAAPGSPDRRRPDRAGPAPGDRAPLAAASSASRRWISATAIAPSPTALPTRLVEPLRTSPAANRPGTLVSSGSGSRSSAQSSGRRPASSRSGPVHEEARCVGAHAGVGGPAGPRRPADADEQRASPGARSDAPPASVIVTAPRWPSCACSSVTCAAQAHVDQRVALDALDEVGGHRLRRGRRRARPSSRARPRRRGSSPPGRPSCPRR